MLPFYLINVEKWGEFTILFNIIILYEIGIDEQETYLRDR